LLPKQVPTILEVTHGDGVEMLEIYSKRAKIAAMRDRFVENYVDLVETLRLHGPKKIVVLHVGTDQDVFLIFMDSTDQRILGVLPGHTGR
jgi:hypothetical protein